ncbi:N-acetylmuramoyl-L-alanine amidase [Dorea formicigenerans]|uniref:N-acetylmuramoyl-L-alanine amidase n=1 Tax=Dorea formicigenerans TaxID=39486 RepID=UPI0035663647
MGVYNVHGGHNFIVPGAKGLLDETTEDRKVTARVITALRSAGHTVYDCTDDSGRTQGRNLANIVAKCNAHPVDLNISHHLNAGGGTGVEVWCYDEKTKDIAAAICQNVSAALGIPNRGVKYSKSLYVLRKTSGRAILVECCFVDNQNDASHWDADKCGDAIASAIAGKAVAGTTASASTPTPAPAPSGPSYRAGTVYTLLADHLRVRTGPGTGYATKSRKQLTVNAREHAYSNGTLKKGTRVTCKDVRKVGSDIWIKIPSGWIAAYYDGKKYVG